MTPLACMLGVHVPDAVNVFEVREGRPVMVAGVLCYRCGIRISEEVHPIGQLPQSDD